MIDQEAPVSSIDLHLEVSQSTALEEHDGYVAQIVQRQGEVPDVPRPDNDGTNACALVCR